ncbi:lipid-A-disaccharide synthase [Permianibacter sp. IMCC34836]|uniref:lipid-A-disaccharide synthase n=1 Tax=Permianibacter fluminis TaxID=2738515 RepID=UPI0015541B98|nr:lipid-A-disaccharide synthase [Permianibacter fluminis]NQD38690.1 lipid-A-disaccharide synthase [Permianibacter fluminis]
MTESSLAVPSTDTPVRVAIVAGEASGDILGEALLKALRERLPQLQAEGIAGPRMQAQHCHSRYPMERLSVMGILAILKRLPELLSVRKQLVRHWLQQRPDVFIGIDAPEFNLGLEEQLRAGGVTTVHFVSPSVWAWRKKRIFTIQRAVDLMLTLFPFEQAIYREHGVGVAHVGHPLADQIALDNEPGSARAALAIPDEARVLAVLPGSRGSELKFLSEPFIRAMQLLQQRDATLHFLVPCATPARRAQFSAALQAAGGVSNLHLLDGQSQTAMIAADAILLASGTATLEAMLIKRPMVVAYKVSGFSYAIYKRLLTIGRFALPNLLSGRDLVPELMQDDCTAEKLADAMWQQLSLSAAERAALLAEFRRLHEELRGNAGARAAEAIIALLLQKGRLP